MGRLYIVATPIGNLEDITLRALRVLSEVPVILAEDTRHTRGLLTRHNIRNRLVSYHAHNELRRADMLLELLHAGDVALVSDAGMPGVSDPGMAAVRTVVEAGVQVEVLPGPSAAVTAWVASGLESPGYLFLGFLPRRSADRRDLLRSVEALPYALVMYEAPHRLRASLADVLAVLGDRPGTAARELTKLHEDITRGTVSDLIARFSGEAPRGELTLVIAGATESVAVDTESAREALSRRYEAGEHGKTAIAAVTAEFGLPRNDVYRLWLEVSGREQER